MAHAHRKLAKQRRVARNKSPSHLIPQFAQTTKIGPHPLDILKERRNGHKSADLQMRELEQSLYQRRSFLYYHASLRILWRKTNFNQHRKPARMIGGQLGANRIELLSQR